MTGDTTVTASETSPSEVEAQGNASADNVEEAQESADQLRERIKELEHRLTQDGRKTSRELEKAKGELTQRDQDLAKAVADNKAWLGWAKTNAPDLYASLTQGQTQVDKKGQNEAAMWRMIASEENPRLKKILIERAEDGKFLDEDTIDLLRDNLKEDPKAEKAPPRVGGARTSGNTNASPDEKLADARKNKDKAGVMSALIEKAKASAGR